MANVSAGTAQTLTVTALDQYLNVATGYAGTVHFTSDDLQASLPATDVSFGTADAGQRAVSVTLKTAGSESVTATDTATSSITGSQAVTVSPGSAARISVSLDGHEGSVTIPAFYGDLPGDFTSCGASAKDAYGNDVPGYTGPVTWTTSDPHAQNVPLHLINNVAFEPDCILETAGQQTITVTDDNNPQISGSITATVVGPTASPDDYTVSGPSQSGMSRYDFNVMANDTQTHALFGNVWLGTFTNSITDVGQVTTQFNGSTYQIGSMAVSSDGHTLVWDLDPPSGTTPANPGDTLVSCPTSGAGVSDPNNVCTQTNLDLSTTYTLSDSLNTSSGTVTLHLAHTPAAAPTGGSATYNGNSISTTFGNPAGVQVQITPQESAMPLPSPASTYTSMPATAVPMAGQPGLVAVAVKIGNTIVSGTVAMPESAANTLQLSATGSTAVNVQLWNPPGILSDPLFGYNTTQYQQGPSDNSGFAAVAISNPTDTATNPIFVGAWSAFSSFSEVGVPIASFDILSVSTGGGPPELGCGASGVIPCQVEFADTSTDIGGANLITETWNFGDPASGGHNSETVAPGPGGKEILHDYTTPGVYTITLTVTDSTGQSATTQQNYVVNPPP